MAQSRFLRACRREPVDRTPIWLMRQAGRYMPEYRALRQKYSMLELIRTPELAAEVTLQPLEAFDLDAAILFSDILPILSPMGLQLSFAEGEGPQIANPVRTRQDVARLRAVPAVEGLSFVLRAIEILRPILDQRGIPLIGFSGAPFTLAAYAVEGRGTRDHLRVKGMMMADEASWRALMSLLADAVGDYLLAQVHAGAAAVQMFDSWAGVLAPDDYRDLVLPYSRRALEIVRRGAPDTPIIHFSTGTAGLLELFGALGADVIGVDWRIGLSDAWGRIGPSHALQGNLDPAVLLAPWEAVQPRVQRVLQEASGRPGHIFNLGHGILPGTPVENVRRLVEFVHGSRD
ncbi:MAG: uroporphyrinogen decarboxylase [Phycisphaerae bacterium]|nr:uroporphyrinogen decarboxylase [Phycisphaerae bacterium]